MGWAMQASFGSDTCLRGINGSRWKYIARVSCRACVRLAGESASFHDTPIFSAASYRAVFFNMPLAISSMRRSSHGRICSLGHQLAFSSQRK